MPRYFIEFSYDGSSYHGIQKQPNSLTIQEVLETNISKYTGSDINLTLAGRTDAGVHATGQVAHVDIEKEFEPIRLMEAINAYLIDYRIKIINKCRITCYFISDS